MRNPLSPIKMNLQSIKREVELGPANRELAGIADQQACRLERMLDDPRLIEIRQEPVGFDDLLNSVSAVVGDHARSKQVTIKPQGELLGAKLMLDSESICRAMANLPVNRI